MRTTICTATPWGNRATSPAPRANSVVELTRSVVGATRPLMRTLHAERNPAPLILRPNGDWVRVTAVMVQAGATVTLLVAVSDPVPPLTVSETV